MMDYGVFKNVIAERIKEFLPSVYSEFDVNVMEVPKINGMREAMILEFESDGCRMSGPNIYLDDFYIAFSECRDLDEILQDIAEVIMEFTGTQHFGKDREVKLDEYKEYVVQMLINTGMNRELLKSAPHKEFLDLSLIYRLAIPDAGGFATALITYEMMDDMGLTIEELDELAEENSRRNLPTQLFRMGPELTMMTTEAKMYGAINLLRTDELKKLSDEMNANLYLLPSSVHDLMVLRDSKYSNENSLFDMLESGNNKCNDPDENLSYNIYYYDREKDDLEVKYGKIVKKAQL